jgi:hypothetical protein
LDGKDDPVLIQIPKGSYVLVFEARRRPAETAPADPVDTRLARSTLWPGRRLIAISATLLATVIGLTWLATGFASFNRSASVQFSTGPNVLVLPYVDLGEGTTSAIFFRCADRPPTDRS